MIPSHVALILDGNRRWARREGLNSFDGHYKGIQNMKVIAEACLEKGVKAMTCYCFSTENWKRSQKEVDYLMRIFEEYIQKYFDEFKERGVRLNHLGRKDRLPKSLLKLLADASEGTKENTELTINLAIDYGSRDEIIRAVNALMEKGDDVTEESLSQALDTRGDDPDLVIRTSGECRLSNFLMWQLAYAEFFFVEKFFPEFSREDFFEVLDQFAARKRRFGG